MICFSFLSFILYERKIKKQERERKRERETKKESATSTNSRSLLGKGDLRETLSYHSNTLRGVRVFKHPVVGKGRLEGDGH
jgi:hypothetical protein